MFWTIATSEVICGSERPKSKFDGCKMRAVYIGHSPRKTPLDSLCWYSYKKTGDFSTDFVQLATVISMNIWVSCTLWLFIVFFLSEYDFLGYRRLEGMYRDTQERFYQNRWDWLENGVCEQKNGIWPIVRHAHLYFELKMAVSRSILELQNNLKNYFSWKNNFNWGVFSTILH